MASNPSYKHSMTLDSDKLLDGGRQSGVLRHIHGGGAVHKVLSADLVDVLFHGREQTGKVLDGVSSILKKEN